MWPTGQKFNMSKELSKIIEIPKIENFTIDDQIICPSDLTGIRWRIIKIDTQGIIHAEVQPDQKSSEHYPKKITISPEAYSNWQKIIEKPPQ